MTIELHNIDCMKYMATQPDNAFDLAICDPPYGINITEMSGRLVLAKTRLFGVEIILDYRPLDVF